MFRFDGRLLSGFAGDSVASALLASGVRVVSRSFKYRRPRGVFSAGIEEPNALVQLHSGARTLSSARAPVAAFSQGLEVRSQSGWPGPSFDFLRLFDFAKPLLAAGFYHKTFMWPSWRLYEPLIRRLACGAQVPVERDPSRYDVRNVHCDVLVVGGGVAGLTAALEAAEAGRRVILAEQEAMLGGRCWWDGSTMGSLSAEQWISNASERLARLSDVHVLTRTTAVSYHDHEVVALVEQAVDDEACDSSPRERYWIVRTQRLVLATGAIEQPLVFSNNDRPGIMLAGAARRYLRCQAVTPGQRVVVATNNDSAYDTVRDLCNAQVVVAAVLDSRPHVPQALIHELRMLNVSVHANAMPVDTSGFGVLKSVTAGTFGHDGTCIHTFRIEADALLVSGGWSPTLHLFAQAGGRLQYQDATGAFEPAAAHPAIHVVGAAATRASGDSRDHGNSGTNSIGPRITPVGDTKCQWVDLRHDVTVADLELALRENYTHIEQLKRYTTLGMAVDQGKTSSAVAVQVVARVRGLRGCELGHTTLRPPFTPVTLGCIVARDVGEQFSPARRSPMHAWHAAHGAVFEDYGEWKRPRAYLQSGEERHDAILREARAVRTSVGLFDASPLGKIEVQGPDAREFLDRFYINNLATLQPGRLRYGLMLRESGVIFDDGTIVALSPDRMLITTTSANALQVGAWLEEWRQCEWPTMRVCITPVTDQWATVAVSGTKSRAILKRLELDCDVSNEAFPHLGVREARLLGAPARIYRVSFTGELTYEINVPADRGPDLWEAILEAGADAGITPYGVDSLLLMRLEKGFLHVGSDTDGTTIPDDVGWGRVAADKQSHYIGKRSLSLPENTRADRLQLVGLAGISDDPIPIGSHLLLQGSTQVTDGWVTSAGRTALDARPIGLALLRGGRQCLDRVVAVHVGGRVTTHARVVKPPFYDPGGGRIYA